MKLSIEQSAKKCRAAAPVLASLNTKIKNKILKEMAYSLCRKSSLIIKENKKDLKQAKVEGLSAQMIDRLLITQKRIDEMSKGLQDVINLPDPVGLVVKKWMRPNGLKVSKVRIPLGVIGVIYESRPNVTVDAAGLCFKSGNAVILRGGSEAFYSNRALGQVLQEVLKKYRLPKELITVVSTTDRGVLTQMLGLVGLIDVLIPRGGEGLMKFMEAHSKIPVIKHDKGVCNLFVDESADIKKALTIIENSKVQRPGVCNALENLFVHQRIALKFMPQLVNLLHSKGVELRGDLKAKKISPSIKKATAKDWDTEYLDLILSIKIVSGMDEAITLIRKHGSNHTESIVTRNMKNAQRFIRLLDSSCVLVNASTRFNDGGQLGLGAEIGISTTKLHAFGPMGLEELTTSKYVVYGEGQIRG